ncbi:MAG TPA: hypothetical protein VGQ41_09260 [Pyrinomonadaceae bacterium]|jgi:hypothetical protein|nr:hypothetical protein [Pyrinomonadaceae bacterium]
MRQTPSRDWVPPLLICIATLFVSSQTQAQQVCFTAQERARAEQTARVYRAPDLGYDPVLGYNPAKGPRRGALPVDANGIARPVRCVANKDETPGAGTTPKFHCSVPGVTDEVGNPIRYKIKPHFKGQSPDKRNGEIYGEFLSSRFSKALGFFADDEWVADVNCPDCQKSLTKSFQGASFSGFQPAAGVELPLGRGIDVNCNNKDSGSLAESLQKLSSAGGAARAEVDAFKLWLAFLDHGDTKADNHKFACLKSRKNADNTRVCEPGEAVFYVGDMGSTWGFSSSSEKKARLDGWRSKTPIEVKNGTCTTTAKSVGDTHISEAGRKLLADNLQRLLDAERRNKTITKVFNASRNAERDRPPAEWTTEFIRKARMIIDARCTN